MAAAAATDSEHKAVKRNDLTELKRLVKSSSKSALALDAYDQTPLHIACFEGHLDIVTFLLKHYKSADLKMRDKNGWTPLHCAASQGHLEIYELIIRKGASPNAQNGDLTSPFCYLCRIRATDKLLELMKVSLEFGADLDMQNRWGETPLHATSAKGQVDSTRFLLDQGASVNTANWVGETALHKAVRSGEHALTLCQLLVERGADIFATAYTGTPRSLAIASRIESLTEFFNKLRRKARKKKKSRHSERPQNQDPAGTSIGSATASATLTTPPRGTSAGNISPSSSGTSLPTSIPLAVPARVIAGPSADNIDLAALLAIRGDDSGGGNFVQQSDKPDKDDLLQEDADFNLDLGQNYEGLAEEDLKEMELKIEDANYYFNYGANPDDVVNVAGEYRNKDGTVKEPFIITILKQPDNAKYRGLIRSKTGDHRFFIPAALIKEKKVTGKVLLTALKAVIPELSQKIIRLSIVADTKLDEELKRFEEAKKRQLNSMKIGVMYCKPGQKTEEEMFGNEHGSEALEKFLDIIGDKIELKGYKGFRGDLDVKEDRTGIHSRITVFHSVEIMYHVSTYLPYSKNDPQQIPRKKFIGNDLSTIVFCEEGATFKPPTVSGDFLHIFAVVSPCKTKEDKEGYKLQIASKKGVPPFGPLLPKPSVFESEGPQFRNFLLTKVLNGDRASLHSPFLAQKLRKSRQTFLEHLIDTYFPNEKV